MKTIIEEYLKCLEAGDAEKMYGLFSNDAIVHSPLYGDIPAKDFFKRLFTETNQSKITLLNTFNSMDGRQLFAAHFRYDWTLKNSNFTSFECMDLFQFNEKGKIKDLTIIYDTYKTRQQLDTPGMQPGK